MTTKDSWIERHYTHQITGREGVKAILHLVTVLGEDLKESQHEVTLTYLGSDKQPANNHITLALSRTQWVSLGQFLTASSKDIKHG